jgi:hypothetical protein
VAFSEHCYGAVVPAAKVQWQGTHPVSYVALGSHANYPTKNERGRSVVEVASWLGHSPTMTYSVYAHVVEELRDSPRIDAEEAIRQARDQHVPVSYPSRADEG